MPTKDGDNIAFVNIRYMDDSGPTKVLRKKYWNEYDWLHPLRRKGTPHRLPQQQEKERREHRASNGEWRRGRS